MSTHLYLAPAGGGKTAYLVDLARQAARDNAGAGPRVVVPTRLQVRAWRERLAQAGGALGVHIGTFDDIYREVLRASGRRVTPLVDAVQVRLLRTLVGAAQLTYYDRIRALPGFVQALRDLIGELKAGGIFPDRFMAAVSEMHAGPRLEELARLYDAYQRRVQQEEWADYAGIGWLAEEDLGRYPTIAADWPCVLVDGFDDLTTVQLQVLSRLAGRVGHMGITLTGALGGAERPLVHKRFNHTCARLERELGAAAEPLPGTCDRSCVSASLQHLERTLYAGASDRVSVADGGVTLAAVPDREAEVRTALRWIKARIVRDGLRPGETALLARSLEPYRAYILQIAAEYGLPVWVMDGQPLRSNPAITALLDLLQLAAPAGLSASQQTQLAWRPTIEAWRSPYFDWEHAYASPEDAEPIGITRLGAEALERVARWGSVIGGGEQWEEAFVLLRQAGAPAADHDEGSEGALTLGLAAGEAEALWGVFRRFCRRITPPHSARSYRDWVLWVEQLVGGSDSPVGEDDGPSGDVPAGDPHRSTSLGLARQAASGSHEIADRDRAALEALKDVLRGLVWGEEALQGAPVTFGAFLEDLNGAIDAAAYHLPLATGAEVVLAATVSQVRGVGFRAVAVLGLAEGEFPMALSEDPFLRDADRTLMRTKCGLPVEDSLVSLETQIFYEAITRPREALLLTRPRIADNGAVWEPSPFWEEIVRRLDVHPVPTTGRSHPVPRDAASWPELAAAFAALPVSAAAGPAWAWVEGRRPDLCAHITHGQAILASRLKETGGPFDGDLTHWERIFAGMFGQAYVWSPTRLEQYRACPYLFFTSGALKLEPRQAPAEGLGAIQLGNIYHRILERLYGTVGREGDLAALLAALPAIAQEVLDAAPRDEQFRVTAYWERTRQGILAHVEQSVAAIEALGDGFRFSEAERTFGIHDKPGPVLVVHGEAGDAFRVHGYIDRVDRDDAGHVRIVDYKTAGPSTFTNAAVRDGKKLQLPLYALAAQEALGLGQVTEGFYWHVQHAKPSGFTLSSFYSDNGHGPRAAMDHVKALAWEAVRGARKGTFGPAVPKGGCPSYCPAAAYCWHYAPRSH